MPLRPTTARFTHVAVPCTDLDATIAWYERHTPLRLLDRREDELGRSAWMGQPDMIEKPFIIVLVSFFRDMAKGPQPTLAPFAHLGIELPTRQDVDDAAARGRDEGPGIVRDPGAVLRRVAEEEVVEVDREHRHRDVGEGDAAGGLEARRR